MQTFQICAHAIMYHEIFTDLSDMYAGHSYRYGMHKEFKLHIGKYDRE